MRGENAAKGRRDFFLHCSSVGTVMTFNFFLIVSSYLHRSLLCPTAIVPTGNLKALQYD